MKVLVTGASGFVGTALVNRLASEPRWAVRACARTRPVVRTDVDWCAAPDLGTHADWQPALEGVDVVVHLAARVHMPSARGAESDAEYRRVNVDGTARLAEQAAASGVRRLVFLSSLKVNGEEGHFTEDSPAAPVDAYGISKRDAEVALQEIGRRTGMEVVVIRPPLVYGPGVKANFLSLISIVQRGVPLPLGAIANRRSFVGVGNLVDLIAVCAEHPAAAGQVFLVSDGEDLSTPELVHRLAAALGTRAWLVPVPVWALRLAATAVGRNAVVDRLAGSLRCDPAKAQRVLGWRPVCTVDEELCRSVGGEGLFDETV